MPQNPGWYKDPWSRFESRWFDGTAWTDLVEEAPGLPGVDPPGPLSPRIDAVVAPVAAASTVTVWEKFRKLPVAGQVAIWCTIGFVLLLLAAGIVTLLNRDPSDDSTIEPLPGDSTSTTIFETTTSSSTTTIVTVPGGPIIVPVTEAPTTTVPETTVVETTLESTTIVETTLEPTTVAETTTTAAPTTVAPTTVAVTAAPTTVAPTTSTTLPPTTTTQAVTTTTAPPDPNKSFCHDAHNDGAAGSDLLESSIVRDTDHTEYTFVANGVWPSSGSDVLLTFTIGDDDYDVVGEVHADSTPAEGYVVDNATSLKDPIADIDIVPGKVTLTVPKDQILVVNGTAFDWVISLSINGTVIDSCSVTNFGTTGTAP